MVIQAPRRTRALTELLRDVSADDISLPVISTDAYRDYGRIVVDGEHILYSSKTKQSFDGLTRGVDQSEGGMPPMPHKGGSFVLQDLRPEIRMHQDLDLISVRPNISFAPGNGVTPTVSDDASKNRSVVGMSLDNRNASHADGWYYNGVTGLWEPRKGPAGSVLLTDSPITVAAVGTQCNFDGWFTSDFTHYEVWFQLNNTMTTAASIYWRFRAGGADRSDNVYYWTIMYVLSNATAVQGSGGLSTVGFIATGLGSTQLSNPSTFVRVTVANPLSTVGAKEAFGQGTSYWANGFPGQTVWSVIYNSIVACDGFAIMASGGVIGVTVWIYGMRGVR